jgi:asparagine synthase (glutamine-hydrolysing)
MCGICGVVHFDDERAASADVVRRMTATMVHRGPDGEGVYVQRNAALGHRRLSIIDLENGAQPMVSRDGQAVIVLNGEIYNYLELRNELRAAGCVFLTQSDTEVALQAYQRWGMSCVERFNGMWAFAIWDVPRRLMFVSRDRIGEKPLHYAVADESFVFGSEIKAILEYGVPRRPALEFLELYLALGYFPAPYTGFQGVRKLKPGHSIIVKDGRITEQKYWDLPDVAESDLRRDRDQVHRDFNELFSDSVRLRMRSDVAFGAFLSGGLDSASVVAVMTDHATRPIETFTMAFGHRDFDESALARLVAERYHTNHHERSVAPQDFDDAIETVLSHCDEPFGDSSAIPTSHIAQRARQDVKMVLTGDGGDEVLSGYNSYQGIKLTAAYRRIPARRVIPPLVSAVARRMRGRTRYTLNKVARACALADLDFVPRMTRKFVGGELATVQSLLTDYPRVGIEEFVREMLQGCRYTSEFYQLMFCDLKMHLPDDMLTKVDRMTMAYSLEARVPFLDHRLIELLTTVGSEIKMEGLERKSILRATLGRRLPRALLLGRKMGFTLPLREWFRSPEFGDRLGRLPRIDAAVDPAAVKRLTEEHQEGKADHANRIWMLFVLNRWLLSFC